MCMCVCVCVCVCVLELLIVIAYPISYGCCLASVRMTKSQQSLARFEPELQITYINLPYPWTLGNGNHQTPSNWCAPKVSELNVGSLVLCLASGLR